MIMAGCSLSVREANVSERSLKGHIENTAAFHSLHPAMDEVFLFLRNVDRASLTSEKTALDGDRVFYFYSASDARPAEAAPLEAHRRYIDIQYLLDGEERIGWKPVAGCAHVRDPYDEEKDIAFFSDAPSKWIDLRPGDFAVFFPEDAHAPLVGTGRIEKIVVKIAVQH
jgi:YhcH/YjgK/YiaL family protein